MASSSARTSHQVAEQFLGVSPLDVPPGSGAPDYMGAFSAWQSLLGASHVAYDDATRAAYAKTTLPNGTRPAGVLRPESAKQVQDLVLIARRCHIPLHAISRGKNWGYGDACARTDGQVIVELTRMNHIRQVNGELGYAVIEPGVSQGQLYAHLRDYHPNLLLDVTGAGPDASIVGNILQRGFGHTPYGDRFRHTSGFEVVLSDGRLLNTGFGQFPNAKAASVFPWGVGPWIDGLFTQSNLGIVTSACVWLMPRPQVIEGFALKLSDGRRLGDLLTALRQLRMGGTVRGTVHVANDLRVLSSRMSYPWERVGGQTPLPEGPRSALRREHGVGVWNVLGASYGADIEVRAARRVIRKAFRGISRVHFFRRRRLERAVRLTTWMNGLAIGRRLHHAVAAASSAFDLLDGKPSREHLNGASWRRRQEPDGADYCDLRDSGLIWVSPVLPLEAGAAQEVLSIAAPIFKRHRFDMLVTMTAVTERALCCVLSINYDKEDRADAEQALLCAHALHENLENAGYLPYRRSSVPMA